MCVFCAAWITATKDPAHTGGKTPVVDIASRMASFEEDVKTARDAQNIVHDKSQVLQYYDNSTYYERLHLHGEPISVGDYVLIRQPDQVDASVTRVEQMWTDAEDRYIRGTRYRTAN